MLAFLTVSVGSLLKGPDGKWGSWRTLEFRSLPKAAVNGTGYFHPSLLCLTLFLSLWFTGLLQFLHHAAHVTTQHGRELLVQGWLFAFDWFLGLEDSLTLLRLTLEPSREKPFWWSCSTAPDPMKGGFTIAPSFALQFHKMGSFRRPRPRFMSSPVLSDLPRFQAARQAMQLSSNSAWNRWAGPTWVSSCPAVTPQWGSCVSYTRASHHLWLSLSVYKHAWIFACPGFAGIESICGVEKFRPISAQLVLANVVQLYCLEVKQNCFLLTVASFKYHLEKHILSTVINASLLIHKGIYLHVMKLLSQSGSSDNY